jgi:hypothetical protein
VQVISEDPSVLGSSGGDGADSATESWGALQTYNSYVDIIAFLTGVTFQLAGSKLTPNYEDVYSALSQSSPYRHRLPLWPLCEDTWGVLGPLMASLPDMCAKLTLLCGPLRIDTDLFHSKRITASTGPFPFMAPAAPGAAVAGAAAAAGAGAMGTSRSAYHQAELSQCSSRALALDRLEEFRDSVQCIEDPAVRIEVWRWVYRRESEAKNWLLAERILDTALQDTCYIRSNATKGSGNANALNSSTMLSEMRGELTLDLVKLQCRHALLELVGRAGGEEAGDTGAGAWETRAVTDAVDGLSLSEPNNIERLLKSLLERSIEISWELQLSRMQGGATGGSGGGAARAAAVADLLCAWDLRATRLYPQVGAFLRQVAGAAKQLMRCCLRLDNHIRETEGKEGGGGPSPQPPLEAIRHFFITKLLADGLSAFPLSEKSIHPHSAASAAAAPAAGSAEGEKGGGDFGKAAAGSSSWAGMLGIGESLISPTAAAARRRADLFCAFSISALVGSCAEAEQGRAYVEQLQALAKSGGKAGKARRFTCRSKYRAIQALRYFPSPPRGGGGGDKKGDKDNSTGSIISYSWTAEDHDLWAFLYCMSELQELRLPCSDETLGHALGISLLDHQVRAHAHACNSMYIIACLSTTSSLDTVLTL